jgi:hypothetical protein
LKHLLILILTVGWLNWVMKRMNGMSVLDKIKLVTEDELETPEEQDFITNIQNMSLQALHTRQALGRMIIKKLRNEWIQEDPEQGELALEKYNYQVNEITKEIRKRNKLERERQGLPKPPDQTIKMKTAQMGANAKRS